MEIGDRAILEGRRAVQDWRSASGASDLTETVRAVGQELASGDGAIFRLIVEGPVRVLHPIVRDEIESVAREALWNALTHACASHIEPEIGFSERLLRLRIGNDGKGIGPEISEGGARATTDCRECGSGRDRSVRSWSS